MAQNEVPDPAPAVERLVRRTDGKVIGGVAGGVADFVGVSSTIARISFLVLALLGGAGIVIYLFGWLLLPRDDVDRIEDGSRRAIGGTPAWVAGALMVVAVGLLWRGSGVPSGLPWALVLIASGFLLLREDPTRAGADGRAARSSPPALLRRSRPALRLGIPRLSPLTGLTLSAVLVVVGCLAVATNFSLLDLSVGRLAAIGLLVVGAGLLVGSRWGRSRLLVVVGLALIPIVAVASVIDVPPRGRVRFSDIVVGSIAELEPRYEFVVARTTLYLGSVDLSGREVDLDLEIGAGEVDVIVPRRVRVDVSADAALGRISVFGDLVDGTDVGIHESYSRRDPTGTLNLDIDAGLGSIAVRRTYERSGSPTRANPARDRGQRREGRREARPRRGGREAGRERRRDR